MERDLTTEIVKQPPPAPLTSDFSAPVALDELDQLAFLTIPEYVRGKSAKSLLAQIAALSAEGARGPAARRLLAREIGLARASLRLRETLMNLELSKLASNRGNEKRLVLLEKMVDTAHRRLLSTIDRFSRLDGVQSPTIRVTANAAQLYVGAAQ